MDLQVAILSLLTLLLIGVVWATIEIRRVASAVGPLADSSIGRLVASL